MQLRGTLAASLRLLASQQQGFSSLCARGAALAQLDEDAPSTSYTTPHPGWQWRRGSGGRRRRLVTEAAAAVAPQPSPAAPTVAAAAAAEVAHGVQQVAAPGAVVYQIVVVTGDVRGAGSPAPAVITLVGTGEGRAAHVFLVMVGRRL